MCTLIAYNKKKNEEQPFGYSSLCGAYETRTRDLLRDRQAF